MVSNWNEIEHGPAVSDSIHPAPVQFTPEQLAADPILHFFHYAHLPAALQPISARFCGLAVAMVLNLPRNAERSTGLRKILEAKDCAVRANVGWVASRKTGTFFDRLKTERDELAGRLDRLREFLKGEQVGVSPRQVALLYDQKSAMEHYLGILTARIEQLGEESRIGEMKEVGDADQYRDGDPQFGS